MCVGASVRQITFFLVVSPLERRATSGIAAFLFATRLRPNITGISVIVGAVGWIRSIKSPEVLFHAADIVETGASSIGVLRKRVSAKNVQVVHC